VETTGVTNVAADKATGVVLFVNLTQREVQIPVDSIVSTSAGTPVHFRTIQPAAVGPRGRVRVLVEALEGGPGGNVRANMINRVEGALSASLKVTNDAATGGGTTSQVKRVTHGDKQRVSDLLIVKLIQKGHAELVAQLDSEILPIETMWINEYTIRTNYDHHVNDQSDTLALEMRAVVGGLATSEEIAQEIARRALLRQVREGFHLLPETVHITSGNLVEIDQETGNVRLLMEGVALMEADIDIRLVQKAIRGQSIDQALVYLDQTLPVETTPTVHVSPSWLSRVPWMPFRISVVKESAVEDVAYALPGP
jgi:hypothetical protein